LRGAAVAGIARRHGIIASVGTVSAYGVQGHGAVPSGFTIGSPQPLSPFFRVRLGAPVITVSGTDTNSDEAGRLARVQHDQVRVLFAAARQCVLAHAERSRNKTRLQEYKDDDAEEMALSQ
jgi:hypothetical protein